jgi:hypothetical protein
VIEQLRNTNVDPAVADSMLSRGVTPAEIVRLSQAFDPGGMRAIDHLVKRGIATAHAEATLPVAKNLGIQSEVNGLINSGHDKETERLKPRRETVPYVDHIPAM